MPIHLFRWLYLNSRNGSLNLGGENYVDLFDDKTSYYHRFGFERLNNQSSPNQWREAEETLCKQYDRIAQLWQVYISLVPESDVTAAMGMDAGDTQQNLLPSL